MIGGDGLGVPLLWLVKLLTVLMMPRASSHVICSSVKKNIYIYIYYIYIYSYITNEIYYDIYIYIYIYIYIKMRDIILCFHY